MVNKGFLFTVEGIIAVVIILMSGLYIYKTFLAVEVSKVKRLEVLGNSILSTLDKQGVLARLAKQGNYSGLENVIAEKLSKETGFRLIFFPYQVISVTSTKVGRWPVEISLNFPRSVNKKFIKVFDSDMKAVPHQVEWNWYRIPVRVDNGNQERVDWPIRMDLNLTGSEINGISVSPDENSIRIFTDTGEEVPSEVKNWRCESTNCSGSVVFLTDLEENETKNLFVYYSVGTLKMAKGYPGFPEFHLLNDTGLSYFFRQWHDIWEVAPYNGTDNGTVHYVSSKTNHPEFWDNHTSLHLYREADEKIDSLVFSVGGSGGENCNWTSSRANFSLSKYPSESRVTLSDDPCPGPRNEFDLSADPEGSWGGPDWDGGVLELPDNWTTVELEQPRPYDDFYWYSKGDYVIENLTGANITVYGHAPNITYGNIEKAPRADLTFLADLENSSTFYVKFSVGTSKLGWKTQKPKTNLSYSDNLNLIENSKLKLKWSEENGSTITEVYYKEYGDENLVGSDEDGEAFDLPILEDESFHPSERLSPWFTKGNFSVLYEGPLRIIARSHSEQFKSSTGEEKNVTRDCYYKFFSQKSFFEVYTKYKFQDRVIAKLGDYYPTSQHINSTYLDRVAYVGEDGRPIPSGRVTDNTSGNWIDEWETDFGVAHIVKDSYFGVRYGKNDVNYGQFKKYDVDHEFVNGTRESFRYWWYFHPGNYTEGNVSKVSELLSDLEIELKYNIPDGTNIKETVFPRAKSVALSPYFIVDNDTFTEVNLLLWYKV